MSKFSPDFPQALTLACELRRTWGKPHGLPGPSYDLSKPLPDWGENRWNPHALVTALVSLA